MHVKREGNVNPVESEQELGLTEADPYCVVISERQGQHSTRSQPLAEDDREAAMDDVQKVQRSGLGGWKARTGSDVIVMNIKSTSTPFIYLSNLVLHNHLLSLPLLPKQKDRCLRYKSSSLCTSQYL